ncbi:hypothetical protein Droror1_Dr00027791 [Drosera rotundifolia]
MWILLCGVFRFGHGESFVDVAGLLCGFADRGKSCGKCYKSSSFAAGLEMRLVMSKSKKKKLGMNLGLFIMGCRPVWLEMEWRAGSSWAWNPSLLLSLSSSSKFLLSPSRCRHLKTSPPHLNSPSHLSTSSPRHLPAAHHHRINPKSNRGGVWLAAQSVAPNEDEEAMSGGEMMMGGGEEVRWRRSDGRRRGFQVEKWAATAERFSVESQEDVGIGADRAGTVAKKETNVEIETGSDNDDDDEVEITKIEVMNAELGAEERDFTADEAINQIIDEIVARVEGEPAQDMTMKTTSQSPAQGFLTFQCTIKTAHLLCATLPRSPHHRASRCLKPLSSHLNPPPFPSTSPRVEAANLHSRCTSILYLRLRVHHRLRRRESGTLIRQWRQWRSQRSRRFAGFVAMMGWVFGDASSGGHSYGESVRYLIKAEGGEEILRHG